MRRDDLSINVNVTWNLSAWGHTQVDAASELLRLPELSARVAEVVRMKPLLEVKVMSMRLHSLQRSSNRTINAE